MTSQVDRDIATAARMRAFLDEVDGYTSMCRVELQSLRIRREASAVLNPLLAPRPMSSRLSR